MVVTVDVDDANDNAPLFLDDQPIQITISDEVQTNAIIGKLRVRIYAFSQKIFLPIMAMF